MSEDRRKAAAGKSGPIDLLKNLTSSASKEKRSGGGGVAGSSTSAATHSVATSNFERDSDRRPLQTFPLSPPDYAIAPEILMDSFVEMPVLFLGIIPNVSSSLDPNNRSEILRCLDNARRQGTLPNASSAYNSSKPDDAAVFSINVYNVKLSRHNAIANEDLIVRVPTHEIASTSYINDDGIHYLAMKISATFGFDSLSSSSSSPAGNSQQQHQQQQQQQAILARRNEEICDLVILRVEEKQRAEEICALVRQSFQLVYTEATMDFFDRQIRDGAGTSVSSSFSITPGGVTSATNSLNSNHDHIVYDPSDISLSNFDGNSTSGSSHNGSGSVRPRSESERSSIFESRELIEDFTRRLQLKLDNGELNLFAQHLTQWHSNSDFAAFCQKVADLFGVERKYMLAEMRPFIPEPDLPYFGEFLRQKDVCDFRSPVLLQGVGITESPSDSWRGQRNPVVSASMDNGSQPQSASQFSPAQSAPKSLPQLASQNASQTTPPSASHSASQTAPNSLGQSVSQFASPSVSQFASPSASQLSTHSASQPATLSHITSKKAADDFATGSLRFRRIDSST